MKQTLHTSRRAFKLALFCLMLMLIGGGNYCLAQEVTLDFTQMVGNCQRIIRNLLQKVNTLIMVLLFLLMLQRVFTMILTI